ncbi:MAG: hypothetical protein U1E65_03665 [Myxococcota bacterium]
MALSDSALALAAVIECFGERRSWTERELARRLRTTPAAVQQMVAVLLDHGWPVSLDHGVWSVPDDWEPGGLALDAFDLADLLRLLARTGRTHPRDTILGKLSRRLTTPKKLVAMSDPVAAGFFAVLQDCAKRACAAEVLYYSRETCLAETRLVSPQASSGGSRECPVVSNRSNSPTSLLMDSVLDVTDAPDRPYFHGSDPPRRVSASAWRVAVKFSVPRSKLRALVAFLPMGLAIVHDGDRIRAEGTVTALSPIARAVLALGAGTVIDTSELRGLVEVLAGLAVGQGWVGRAVR